MSVTGGPFFARPSKEDDCEGSQRPSRIMMSEGFNERGEYKQDVKMLHRSWHSHWDRLVGNMQLHGIE